MINRRSLITGISKVILLVLLCGCVPVSAGSEEPAARYQPQVYASFTGGSDDDYSFSLEETFDGGCILTGKTVGFGAEHSDAVLIKYAPNGTIEWAKVMRGSGWENGESVKQTADGGYIMTGRTTTLGAGIEDILVVRFDADGNFLWGKTVGGDSADWGYSLELTSDGGFVVAGYTQSFGAGSFDICLLKFTAAGNLTWARTVGGSAMDWGYSVVESSDNDYIIVGFTQSYGAGNNDVLMVSFSSTGSLEWTRTFGGSLTDNGNFVSAYNSGVWVTGFTRSAGAGAEDLFVLNVSNDGALQWGRTIGGTELESGQCLVSTLDSGVVVAGSTATYGNGNYDAFYLKLDSSGNLLWANTFGGNGHDEANHIAETSDGGYLLSVNSSSYGPGVADIGVIRVDGSGGLSDCSAVGTANPTVATFVPEIGTPEPTVTDPDFVVGTMRGMEIGDFLPELEFSCSTCIHDGDVNFDGSLTAGDAQLAFTIAMGGYPSSPGEECAADCNADGEVTAGDAQLIFGASLGMGQCLIS